MSDKPDRVLLGEIGAAQGLKGEVRLRSYTQDPEAIARYGALEDEQGRAIEIERARLPEREEDEWYHLDLIGLAAVARDGVAIGSVVAVHNFGAGDLIEVQPAAGGATVLVPFTRDSVPVVDVEGGRLTLVPPEGLFE